MTKILVDKLPETCSDCPLYQAPIIIPITNELSQNIPAKCSIGKKILNVGAGFRRYRTMTNDKAYCIRSNKFMDKPRTNTDCDRHEANVPQGKLCKRKSIPERDRYVRAGAAWSSAE